MLKERETVLRRFLIFVDASSSSLAYLFAFLAARASSGRAPHPLQVLAVALAIAIPYWCLTLYANGMYHSMRTRSYLEILWAVIKSAVRDLPPAGHFHLPLQADFHEPAVLPPLHRP